MDGAAALLVGWVSFIDDRSPLPARTLLAQLCRFSARRWTESKCYRLARRRIGAAVGLGLVGRAVVVVWVCNLYNFMDG